MGFSIIFFIIHIMFYRVMTMMLLATSLQQTLAVKGDQKGHISGWGGGPVHRYQSNPHRVAVELNCVMNGEEIQVSEKAKTKFGYDPVPDGPVKSHMLFHLKVGTIIGEFEAWRTGCSPTITKIEQPVDTWSNRKGTIVFTKIVVGRIISEGKKKDSSTFTLKFVNPRDLGKEPNLMLRRELARLLGLQFLRDVDWA